MDGKEPSYLHNHHDPQREHLGLRKTDLMALVLKKKQLLLDGLWKLVPS